MNTSTQSTAGLRTILAVKLTRLLLFGAAIARQARLVAGLEVVVYPAFHCNGVSYRLVGEHGYTGNYCVLFTDDSAMSHAR